MGQPTEENSSFEAMVDERIIVFCGVCVYRGFLGAVREDYLELVDPQMLDSVGDLTNLNWSMAHSLPSPWRVMKRAIESWGPG